MNRAVALYTLSLLILLGAATNQRLAAQAAPAPAAPTEAEPVTPPELTPTPAVEPPAVADPVEVPADTPADDVTLQAELAKLGLEDAAQGGGTVDRSLKLSGFADFGLLGVLGKAGWRGAYERFPAFAIGNFNIYIDKSLTDTLRMFGEVRFTLLPNGTAEPGSAPGDYQRAEAEDYANFKRPIRWGGVYIPRVYLEWSPHRLLSLRAGIFLTPYGIWNVDHGSPTVITAQRPFIISQALFPERQTGVEALGQFDVGAHSTIGYHLTVSNGLGAVSEYRDFDANKALGARLYWTYDGIGQLRLGASGFYGTDTTAHERGALAADGKVTFTQEINTKSDVLALAADLEWRYQGFVLQSELVTQQRKYDERGRTGAVNPLLGEFAAPPDKLSWGVYGLVGYRFEWFGVMPYVLLQTVDILDANGGWRYRLNAVFAGLNIRPVDVLVIKLEYSQSHFPSGFLFSGDSRIAQFQLAWAF